MSYNVDEEVRQVLEHVQRLAGKSCAVTFGTLFQDEQVEQVFESLVQPRLFVYFFSCCQAGTLKAAKKRGLLDFPGHLLLFPTHQDVKITLKGGQTPPLSLLDRANAVLSNKSSPASPPAVVSPPPTANQVGSDSEDDWSDDENSKASKPRNSVTFKESIPSSSTKAPDVSKSETIPESTQIVPFQPRIIDSAAFSTFSNYLNVSLPTVTIGCK